MNAWGTGWPLKHGHEVPELGYELTAGHDEEVEVEEELELVEQNQGDEGEDAVLLVPEIEHISGVYKVPYNLIFFPIPFFFNLDFSSHNFPTLSLFFRWYSSEQPQYYRKDDIASLLPFPPLYSSSQHWYFLPLFTTWYSSPTGTLYTPVIFSWTSEICIQISIN